MKLFWLGLIWLAGIAAGGATGLSAWIYLLGAALGLASWVLAQGWLKRAGPGILLFSLGAFRFALAGPQIDGGHLAFHNDSLRPVVLTGIVSDFPDVRDRYIGLRIESEGLQYSETEDPLPASGSALVQASRFRTYSYGDRVQAVGFLETPPESEEFSYRDYLARQGIHSLMSNAAVTRLGVRQGNPVMQVVFDLRLRALDTVYLLFPDPEASLLAGILLGVESGISEEVREAFNDTSTTHIIAISGFNLTVLAAAVISLFGRWLGMRRGAVAATVAILLYTLLVGADAAVVRAAIMGGLALLARYLGRQSLALVSLSAAAVAMTLVNPLVLWDVGFQLSFAATLGLVLYADPIKNRFVQLASRWLTSERAERLAEPVGEYALFTLAAQVTTLPLTALYFQRLSLVSLLANPVVLPAQPPLMMLGGLAVLAGLIWLPLGRVFAAFAWPFPAFTVRAVTFFAGFPSAAQELDPVAIPAVVAIYALLFGATAWAALPPERRASLPRPSAAVSMLALAVATGLTWRAAFDRPDGLLRITAFESGASLIETPTGRFVLVNGGNSPTALSQDLGRRLPLFNREIDWLVISDSSNRQLRGLAGLTDRVRVRGAMWAGESRGAAYERVVADLTRAGVSPTQAAAGQALDLGGGARLEVVWVSDGSVRLRLTRGNASFELIPEDDRATEMTKTHSTAVTAWILTGDSSVASLSKARPQIVILSATSQVASPSEGIRLLQTSELGWVMLATDGDQVWAWSER